MVKLEKRNDASGAELIGFAADIKARHSRYGGRTYCDRVCRYRVLYTTEDGHTDLFGETHEADGGMPLACAKLLKWVKSAYVVDKVAENYPAKAPRQGLTAVAGAAS